MRLTSNRASKKRFDNLHNFINATFAKNNDVWLRDWGGKDRPLIDVCAEECLKTCGIKQDMESMAGADCGCFVAHFYRLAVGHCELRERLKEYEDKEFGKEDI